MTDADSLKAARNREIYGLWKSITDIIEDASKWPKILDYFGLEIYNIFKGVSWLLLFM